MAESKIGILISAKDNASGTIKNVKGSLNDLGKGVGEINGVSSAFGALGKAVGLAGLAFGALEVGRTVVELAQVGAQAQRVEDSFRILSQQAGISADSFLASMQKASGGTIANTDLMLTANRSLALGVADSSEEISQLLQVAIARGKALGLSATTAFNDLVTGIGRMSPLILDNLGIVTGGEKVFNDYAASIGKTAESLSDAERKQALVNKVISESAELVKANAQGGNDAAASFERAAAAFSNLKADLGELFGPAIAAFAEQLASAVDAVASGVSSVGETLDLNAAIGNIEIFQASLSRANDELILAKEFLAQTTVGSAEYAAQQKVIGESELQVVRITRELAATKAAYFAALRQAYPAQIQTADAMNRTSIEAQALAQSTAIAANAMGAATAGLNAQQVAASNLSPSIARLTEQLDLLVQRSNILASVQSSLGSIASQVVGAAGAQTGVAFFNDLTAATETQVKAWQDAKFSGDEITNVLMPAYRDEVRKSAEATYGFGASAVKANKAAAASVKALNQDYEDLKGKISGVISGALGDDLGGVNLDNLLPRQDSVAEDARRLADVAVNGFASPWADYFKEKFPELFSQLTAGGDIKTAAAQMLRDFQDGLRPELIDKDKAKEIVKRAIIGDKNTKALVDEIAKELAAEMGISIAQAQQAATAALGGGASGISGAGDTKRVSVVPTIDTSQLPAQGLSIKASLTSLDFAEGVSKTISLDGSIATLKLAVGVGKPVLAGEMAIDKIVIAEGVKPPVPIITGGMTIDSVFLRSDVVLPSVTLAAQITSLTINTTANTETPLQLSAVVAEIGMSEEARKFTELPRLLTAVIVGIGLAADAELPAINLSATITNLTLGPTAATETPLKLSAVIDWQATDTETPRTALIESMGLKLSAYVDWKSVDTETPRTGLIEKMGLGLSTYINWQTTDTETPKTALIEKMPLGLVPFVDWKSTDTEAAKTGLIEKMVLGLSPYINWALTDTETARIALTEKMVLSLSPFISTETIDTTTALTYLEQELAPIVTPYINYLGVLPETLQAAGGYIAAGIAAGITTYNLGSAIVGELNKAQQLLRTSGISSGQNWGAGFNSGASEYITGIVSTVVSLALAQISRSATKTGAS